jgi:hypothetical protein
MQHLFQEGKLAGRAWLHLFPKRHEEFFSRSSALITITIIIIIIIIIIITQTLFIYVRT